MFLINWQTALCRLIDSLKIEWRCISERKPWGMDRMILHFVFSILYTIQSGSIAVEFLEDHSHSLIDYKSIDETSK